MKYDIELSTNSARQLLDIAIWYAERAQSLSVGERWHEGASEAIQGLTELPDRFPLAHETHLFNFELREMLYGSGRRKTHRILFRIDGRRVIVLAVRHFSQRDLTPDDL